MTSGHPTPPRPISAAQGLLAALVGLALVLAAMVVGAVPAAAENGVGASTPVMINIVGHSGDIGAGQRLGETALLPWIVVATGVAANTGRFELTALGSSRYQTPAGLIYGPGSQHGHRLTHVLQHGFPDATKKTHSVFTSGSGALRTVDEAWLMRGAPDPSDLGKYVIPMGRTVGTGGETSVTVIVRPGTSQIITAYPSP